MNAPANEINDLPMAAEDLSRTFSEEGCETGASNSDRSADGVMIAAGDFSEMPDAIPARRPTC
jgi:hypothetical protein